MDSKKRLRNLKAFEAAALQLALACRVFVDPDQTSLKETRQAAFDVVSHQALLAAVETVEALARQPGDERPYAEILKRYAMIRRVLLAGRRSAALTMGFAHINLFGRYDFGLSEALRKGLLRPLREPERPFPKRLCDVLSDLAALPPTPQLKPVASRVERRPSADAPTEQMRRYFFTLIESVVPSTSTLSPLFSGFKFVHRAMSK